MNMHRRIRICFLAALLALCVSAFAESTDMWDFNADNGSVTAYRGEAASVTIPETIRGIPVQIIGERLLNMNGTVSAVQIPDTVRLISNAAFYSCEALTQVNMPKSLEVVDNYAFYNCEGLTALQFPASLGYVGNNAFFNCGSVTSVTFEGLPPSVGRDAFKGMNAAVFAVPDDCVEAYRAILPQNAQIVTTGKNAVIWDYTDPSAFAFDAETGTVLSYYGSAPIVSVPAEINGAAVTAIGERAFWFKADIYRLDIPEGVVSIGEGGCSNMGKLGALNLPSTLRSIGKNAFTYYNPTTLTLPEGLETIGVSAFDHANITLLTLPEGLVSIGDEAFFKSSHLEKIYFPASIQEIGERAFARTNVNYLAFAGCDVPQIAESAFDETGKQNITDVDMAWDAPRDKWAQAAARFAEMGFSEATVWRANPADAGVAKRINFSDGANYVNGYLTSYTGTLPDITVYSSAEYIDVIGVGDGCFRGSTTLRSFYPHHCDWFTTIGNEAFADSSLAYIELFDSITTIGSGAFRNCANMKELTIPSSVTFIGAKAFDGCTGLEKVVILCDPSLIPEGSFPQTADVLLSADATDEQLELLSAKLNRLWYHPVMRIGETVTLASMPDEPTDEALFEFDPDEGMITRYIGTAADIAIPREIGGVPVRGIRSNAFDDCRDYSETDVVSNVSSWVPLRSVVIPETVEIIEDRTFSYCQQLQYVVCYAPLETTGRSTFLKCRALEQVIFVNGVRQLDNYLFEGCASLETVYAGTKLQRIGNSCFVDSGIAGFTADAVEIANYAFLRCRNLTELHLTARVQRMEMGAVNDCPKLSLLCIESESAEFLPRDGLAAGIASELTVAVPSEMSEEQREIARRRAAIWGTGTVISVTTTECDRETAAPELPELSNLPEMEFAPPAQIEAQTDMQPTPIGQEGQPYFGTWYAQSMTMGDTTYQLSDLGIVMSFTLREDGVAVISQDGEEEAALWYAQDSGIRLDTMTGALNESGELILFEDGGSLLCTRSQPEKREPIEISGDVGAYLGDWYCLKMVMGDFEFFFADYGVETVLTLNSDGTAIIDSDGEQQHTLWFLNDGVASMLDGSVLVINENGELEMREEEGFTVFTRTKPASSPIDADSNPEPVSDGAGIVYGAKYVCVNADVNGVVLSAEMLGSEYSVVVQENGTADFIISGVEMNGLQWTMTDSGFDCDYYGVTFVLTVTEAGLDMNYFDTMLLHYVLAQ